MDSDAVLCAVGPSVGRNVSSKPIPWFDGGQVPTQVLGQLIEDNLPLFSLVLALGRFPVKHGFTIRDQR